MNVLIISLFGFSLSGRSAKIAFNVFTEDNVSVVTTDFSHGKKQYHKDPDSSLPIKPVRLHVPAYTRNLSFRRIYSHISFARSLKKYLKRLPVKPDIVYCAMPSSSVAYVAGKFCKRNNILFVIDVIDLWPDSLIPIMPFRRLIKICLTPWRMITNKAYKMADYISAESQRYAEVAHKVNMGVPCSYTYLGVDNDKVNQMISESDICLNKLDDEIWIGYGGSLGQSYDFDVILKGINYLKKKGIKYKMWFIGDGEKADYIREIADKHGLNVVITGRLDYKDLLKYLSYCDIAINSFKEGTLVVHSYKFNDYVAVGCYVLNNLPGETADMIDQYGIGKNFNKESFNDVLYKTATNWSAIKSNVHQNLQNLIAKELNQATIYKRLRDNINKTILR